MLPVHKTLNHSISSYDSVTQSTVVPRRAEEQTGAEAIALEPNDRPGRFSFLARRSRCRGQVAAGVLDARGNGFAVGGESTADGARRYGIPIMLSREKEYKSMRHMHLLTAVCRQRSATGS